MPPKPKRQPAPTLLHLKHSRQLLEDFLYQYLPQLSGMSSVSRINLFTWFSGKWGLTTDAKGGIPYMLLEALRQQRQHLLTNKGAVKPLSLTLFGAPDDKLLPRALPYLQALNKQSHTATVGYSPINWQEVVKQLQVQLQRQPAAERNLLVLDPTELPMSNLQELLPLLPKRLDVLLLLPTSTILTAGGHISKTPPHAAAHALAVQLKPLMPPPPEELQEEEKTTEQYIQEIRLGLQSISNRFAMHYLPDTIAGGVCLYGLSTDAFIVEKMLQARQKLEQLRLEQLQAGNQLGLFAGTKAEAVAISGDLQDQLLQLLKQQAEWDNQALYVALLQQELIPQQTIPSLLDLVAAGQLEILDEKKKKLKKFDTLPLSHTAYRLPAPSRYFRLKE